MSDPEQQMLFSENTLSGISIHNRRYLGSKYSLLQFIRHIADQYCAPFCTFADIFAGTGVVASAFQDKPLIINDILYSNHICHTAWFSPQRYSSKKVTRFLEYYNSLPESPPLTDDYMTRNFSDTYFSRFVCQRIDFIRDDIERAFSNSELNQREYALLITSLLYGIDKIANTCGHYDAWRRNASCPSKFELCFPITQNNNPENQCFNLDANELIRRIQPDITYIDPPYNSRQYCDAYHVLENVARWNKPPVTGIARKMNRDTLKSSYCTNSATNVFNDLIVNIHSRFIILSYNNTGQKGDGRSNAKISDDDIMSILSTKGTVKIFSVPYKIFSAGKTRFADNEERLFFCQCR